MAKISFQMHFISLITTIIFQKADAILKKNQSGIYVNCMKRISNPDIEMSLIKANEAEAIAEFPRGQPA